MLNATKRSLLTLAEASGCDLDSIDREYAASKERLPDGPERPLSALSTLSDMSWKSDLESTTTYLQ